MLSAARNLPLPVVRTAFVALFAAAFFCSPAVSLFVGILFALTLGNPFPAWSRRLSKMLLQGCVVGLGFGMNFHDSLAAGRDGMLFTIVSVVTVMAAGVLLGRLMRVERKGAYLISAGTAICGGSAIAAVAPVIDADENETSLSLATIFVLNAVALFLFPVAGRWLGLSQADFGVWSAIAIHDTSSVVGAGAAYGDEALRVATTVKLTRALWIIPLSIVSMFVFRRKGGEDPHSVVHRVVRRRDAPQHLLHAARRPHRRHRPARPCGTFGDALSHRRRIVARGDPPRRCAAARAGCRAVGGDLGAVARCYPFELRPDPRTTTEAPTSGSLRRHCLFLSASAVFSGSASLPLRLCPTRYRRCLFGPIPACLGFVSVCLEDRFLPVSDLSLSVWRTGLCQPRLFCRLSGTDLLLSSSVPAASALLCIPARLGESPLSFSTLRHLWSRSIGSVFLRFLPPPQVCSVFSGSLRYRFSALHSCALRSACGRHPRPYLASGRRSAADRPLGYSRGDCGSVWSE